MKINEPEDAYGDMYLYNITDNKNIQVQQWCRGYNNTVVYSYIGIFTKDTEVNLKLKLNSGNKISDTQFCFLGNIY